MRSRTFVPTAFRILAPAAFMVASIAGMLARAHAKGTTSALSWVRLPGTESCLSTADLGTRVEARLGRSVFVSPSVADVSIEGHVELLASPRRFRVVIGGTRHDGTRIGTRELESNRADCHVLDDDIVLVV